MQFNDAFKYCRLLAAVHVCLHFCNHVFATGYQLVHTKNFAEQYFTRLDHFPQKNGVEKNLGLGTLSDYEKELVKGALPELLGSIKKGEDFVAKN